MSAAKERAKALLGEGGRMRYRRLSRARWLAKRRVLADQGPRGWERPGRALRFLLLDPEIDSFNYRIANEADLALRLGTLLETPPDAVAASFAEAHEDPVLTDGLAQRLRFRPDHRHRPPLNGKNLAAWAIVRLRRPELVVESGVLDGMGSTVLLRALERNAQEGGPDGRLLSFDVMPGAGWVVPQALRARWELTIEPTAEALPRALAGRTIDVMDFEALPRREPFLEETAVALAHGRPGMALMSSYGYTEVLDEVAERTGGRSLRFQERSIDHVFAGCELGFCVVGEEVGA